MITVLVMTVLLGMTAMAADSKLVTMKREKNKDGSYSYTAYGECSSGDMIYHKIEVPTSGYLLVTAQGYSSNGSTKYSVYTTLLNSQSKVYQPRANLTVDIDKEKYAVYGLKKGTYYVCIKTVGEVFGTAAVLKPHANQSGSTKAKATSFASKKWIKGLFAPSDSLTKSEWFKMKVTKNGYKMRIDYDVAGCGTLDMTVYGPGFSSSGSKVSGVNGTSYLLTKNAVNKGTYYVRVRKNSAYKMGSAAYRLKWKLVS